MTDPVLSVVMPVRDGARHIGAALDSIATQSLPGIEIIVVDDGSTDETAQIVAARAAASDSVHLIQQANAGVSAARNRGIAAARADLVGFLDADDLWHPDKAARQIETLREMPGIVLTYTGFRIVDMDGTDLLERSSPPAGQLPLAQLMHRNVIHTSSVIVRAKALQAACREGACFDAGLRCFEDFDLWCRIAALPGATLYGLSDPLCDYRRHEGQATKDWRAMHEGWRAVAERLAQAHPRDWASAEGPAWAHQLEYCASLAWNAGDVAEMRRLMIRALRFDAGTVMARTDGRIMTGILACSYLPRRMQLVIGRAFVAARRAVADRRST
ncbi:glycosyltransferase [Jannaschia sp.]|nr:glycosyltransferase [Jannaschia sp.]